MPKYFNSKIFWVSLTHLGRYMVGRISGSLARISNYHNGPHRGEGKKPAMVNAIVHQIGKIKQSWMAASEASDDSFRVRVKKIFGSLTSSSSQRPSSLQSTLWSLTDDEVERREWRRGDTGSSDRDEIPCSSSFDELIRDRRRSFRRELQHDLDDGEHESNTLRSRRMGTDGLDEWDIRSSIGLDRTLDNEV